MDFEHCTGSYRIRIVYPDGKEIYFADNSGLMYWYIRTDAHSAGFYTSLHEAAPKSRTPDEPSIAQFLYYGCIYDFKTVIQEVQRSNPNKYYLLKDGRIEEKEKQLTPLEKLSSSTEALKKQMTHFSESVSALGNIACTITGGVDSRAILSHMLCNGLHPLLDITGVPTDDDVIIAKKISARLEMKLLFVEDTPEDAGWIDEAIQAADGMSGICGLYRLYKKAKFLSKEGIILECGGGAGELYKNSFINQDYPFYGGKPRWEHFLRFKVATYDFPTSICGPRLAQTMNALPEETLTWLRSHTGKTKASAYLSAGYEILQGRGAAANSMASKYYVPYSPLLERNVAAPMFRQNPYSLEMQAFQRDQVSSYCPAIKSIETDRGLTCDSGRKSLEQIKSTCFLINVALKRIFKRNQPSSRIDTCFEEGLSSPQYRAALERCKELGIIAPEVKDLPMAIADRVFALGTIL